MTSPTPNSVNTLGAGNASNRTFVEVFLPRDPTQYDVNYQVQQRWWNTNASEEFILVGFTTTNGQTFANWVNVAFNVGIELLEGNTGGPVAADINDIVHVVGDGTTITIVGDPLTHTLTASLIGGLPAINSVNVDAHTSPGTDPVLPAGNGQITVTGGQVAAGTTTNVIRTDSLAANTYTVEIQRSQAVSSSTIGDNGVCHFSSNDFAVDSNGFVTILPGNFSVHIQTFTGSGTYTPIAGMVYCNIEAVGGGGGGGSCSSNDGSHASAGGGGGAGGYVRGLFNAAAIGVSQAITIGSGGSGGTAGGGSGTSGTSTTVGALITASGGNGGDGASSNVSNFPISPGEGSGGSGGNFVQRGGNGGVGWSSITGCFGGFGGDSFFGGGAFPVTSTSSSFPGFSGIAYGGGGGGAAAAASLGQQAGGDGGPGFVIITEYVFG